MKTKAANNVTTKASTLLQRPTVKAALETTWWLVLAVTANSLSD
jgi:hypothetical protein